MWMLYGDLCFSNEFYYFASPFVLVLNLDSTTRLVMSASTAELTTKVGILTLDFDKLKIELLPTRQKPYFSPLPLS